MSIFNSKENTEGSELNKQKVAQAKKLGISLLELDKLYDGKSCPKYGTKEILHARIVRGGKLVVFNISDKFRGEKISNGRKKLSKAV
jgi:hypothetical protein